MVLLGIGNETTNWTIIIVIVILSDCFFGVSRN